MSARALTNRLQRRAAPRSPCARRASSIRGRSPRSRRSGASASGTNRCAHNRAADRQATCQRPRSPGACGMIDSADAQSRARPGGVQRPPAAVGDHARNRAASRPRSVVTRARRRPCWRGDAQDAVRGLVRPRPSGSANLRRAAPPGARRRRGSSRRRGTVGAKPPEHQVGVGDGRLGAAQAVAGRARLGAGALRPDVQRAAASTRAMLPPPVPTSWMSISGICDRQPFVVAADQRAAGDQDSAVAG